MHKRSYLELLLTMNARTDPYSVDLHGTTGAEAVYIVRDIISSLDVSGAYIQILCMCIYLCRG